MLVDYLVLYRPAVPVVVTLRAEYEEVDQRGMKEQMLDALERPEPADVTHMAG
jgi:hypothetical protein